MSQATAFLRQLLADEGGSISVERFLWEALYHPVHGYYARNVRTVGRRGDFSTSATLHPALGQAIARWLRAHAPSPAGVLRAATNLTSPPWHVIELGPGTGELAAGVLGALGWQGRRGLQYHLVEVSAGLRREQKQRLGERVRWHDDLAAALAAAEGRALIFSNEFVDAFPCEQLAWDAAGEAWREVRVRCAATGQFESFAPESCAGGQRIERHASYRRWQEQWAPGWRSGRLLTLDYGGVWPEMYVRRPAGTLRAYWHHQRFAGPEIFARFGQQDLTADVNFTDLERWGAALGWRSAPLTGQADFLRRWLPARTLARTVSDPTLSYLLDRHGAGGAFRVLEQWPWGGSGVKLSA